MSSADLDLIAKALQSALMRTEQYSVPVIEAGIEAERRVRVQAEAHERARQELVSYFDIHRHPLDVSRDHVLRLLAAAGVEEGGLTEPDQGREETTRESIPPRPGSVSPFDTPAMETVDPGVDAFGRKERR